MVDDSTSARELEERLRAGEWLTIGQVATVLGVGRTTVNDWLDLGHTKGADPLPLTHRKVGAYRKVNPANVLAILARHREVHGA